VSALDVLLRFVLGGLIVSAFALIGELFTPKTFAGMFGAAPSVALATLSMAYASKGSAFVADEARSMILGAVAFVGYASVSAIAVRRHGTPVWLDAAASWLLWAAIAFSLLALQRSWA
jgi:hypothetical protein